MRQASKRIPDSAEKTDPGHPSKVSLSWRASALSYSLTSSGVASGPYRQPAVSCRLPETPGPPVIEVLIDAFLAAEFGNAGLTAKAFQHDAVGDTHVANKTTNVRPVSAAGHRRRDLQRQKARKPARCQRISVCGLMIFRASSTSGAER